MGKGRQVLVTGANGFVGKALCRELVKKSWDVRGTVRCLQSLSDPVLGVCAVVPLPVDNNPWPEILKDVDIVIHLAARVHVMRGDSSGPLTAYRLVNVAETEKLAREAAKAGVRRFVFLSSVKVNGEGGEGPYMESDEPRPLDPYGISKWEAEILLKQVAAETGLEVVIIRSPLVYGPGVKANFLRMLKVVRQGVPLPFAGINNRRSLIYLGNLVDAIIACINHTQAAGNIFMVSDGEDVSTPELLCRTGKALGQPAWLFRFSPALMTLAGRLFGKTATVKRLLGSLTVDCSKIRSELGWTPPFTMTDGLKETAEWFNHEKNL